MPLPLAASARCWYWSWTFLVWSFSTGLWPCCDCCCHWSQLTKYTWSLGVLPVLMRDISRSAHPALSHSLTPAGPSMFADAPSYHAWSLLVFSAPHFFPFPSSPANPHPSEPCSWRPALTTSLLQTASLLCSSPAAGPTWTAHQAQDSGRLWVSSHVSPWWIPVSAGKSLRVTTALSSNLPGLDPPLGLPAPGCAPLRSGEADLFL